ncbi:hypothetical protein FAGAP_6206 [Fusarium agapanthi]|uniref:Uncharacterized protein n=1 Tax=Fusarium agapanthi TaxID=1803897 RepID=A0A9P5E6I2_9HYPO|nr:hypothetical protein FAGAP_6206 [Fusarium agapanthi]
MTDLVTYLQSFGGTDVPEWEAMNWFFCAKECANREINEWLIHKPMNDVCLLDHIIFEQYEQSFWDNIRSMFYNSHGAFHTGLGLLAASVLLATLFICGWKESVYDINMSRLASAILTASYFLTLPIYLDIERKSISGEFLGIVIWLLFIVVMGLSSTAETAARLHGRVPFEANCWD